MSKTVVLHFEKMAKTKNYSILLHDIIFLGHGETYILLE